MPVRILIVDDSASFLAAAGTLLEGSEFTVVGQATNAAEAMRQIHELQPDVILIDIDLGDDDGFKLAQEISERGDGTGVKLILISADPEEEFDDLLAESPERIFINKSDLSATRLAELLRDS